MPQARYTNKIETFRISKNITFDLRREKTTQYAYAAFSTVLQALKVVRILSIIT